MGGVLIELLGEPHRAVVVLVLELIIAAMEL